MLLGTMFSSYSQCVLGVMVGDEEVFATFELGNYAVQCTTVWQCFKILLLNAAQSELAHILS